MGRYEKKNGEYIDTDGVIEKCLMIVIGKDR